MRMRQREKKNRIYFVRLCRVVAVAATTIVFRAGITLNNICYELRQWWHDTHIQLLQAWTELDWTRRRIDCTKMQLKQHKREEKIEAIRCVRVWYDVVWCGVAWYGMCIVVYAHSSHRLLQQWTLWKPVRTSATRIISSFVLFIRFSFE